MFFNGERGEGWKCIMRLLCRTKLQSGRRREGKPEQGWQVGGIGGGAMRNGVGRKEVGGGVPACMRCAAGATVTTAWVVM